MLTETKNIIFRFFGVLVGVVLIMVGIVGLIVFKGYRFSTSRPFIRHEEASVSNSVKDAAGLTVISGAEAQYYIGQQYMIKKNYTEALKCFKQAIVLNSKEVRYYQSKALAEILLKDFVAAKNTLNQGLQIDPQNQELNDMLKSL